MILRSLIYTLCAVTLVACGNATDTKETVEIQNIDPIILPKDNFHYDTLKGIYIGDFGGSDIRIILNYVSQTNVIGYNIHKGLQRNLNGKIERSGDSITMTLNEPGDNEFDGVFSLLFIGEDENPTGSWKSNSGKISGKNFTLEKLIKPTKDSKEVNASNFADRFGYMTDTLGHYLFQSDGLCIFEYYPNEDYDDEMAQLVQIQGTWSLKGKTVTIDWEKNPIFKNRRMILEIGENEYEEYELKNESITLYGDYYY